MRQMILALSATVAAIALAPSAQAATTISFLSNGSVLTGSFGSSHTTGAFVDEYEFTVPDNIGADALVTTFASMLSANLNFDPALSNFSGNAFFYTGPGPIEALSIVTGSLSAGLHTMTIAGNVTGDAGSYSGTINVYVPEPETWAMMVAGFGLAGMAMRRRSAARKVAVSFV